MLVVPTLLLASAAACFEPAFDTPLFCGPAGECPDGQACVLQRDVTAPRVCVSGGCEAASANADGQTPCQTDVGLDGLCVAGACAARGCGDTVLDLGEACDLGAVAASAPDATCTPTCSLPTCGDGVPQPSDQGADGELCDDGPANGVDAACLPTCVRAACGDGLVRAPHGATAEDPAEACDDGNQNPVDGCDACRLQTWEVELLVAHSLAIDATRILPAGVVAYREGTTTVTLIADPQRDVIWRLTATTDGERSLTVLLGDDLQLGGNPRLWDADGRPVLLSPQDVAVDGAGRVYVADTGNRRVLRIDPSGAATTIAGGGRLTFATASPNIWAAPVPAIELDLEPVALDVDGRGGVLVVDRGQHVVWQVDAAGQAVVLAGGGTLAPGHGPGPAPAPGAPAILAQTSTLNSPSDVAVAPDGDVFIADTGNQVLRRVFTCDDLTAPCIKTVLQPPPCPAPADYGSALTSVAVQPGAPDLIYLAQSSCVRVLRDGEVAVATIPASGLLPSRVAADVDGEVLVSDTVGYQLLHGAPDAPLHVLAGEGLAPPAPRGPVDRQVALATSASIRNMTYAGESLYFVDGAIIWQVDAAGVLRRVAGQSRSGFAGDDGAEPRDALFAAPRGLAARPGSGSVYIADLGNRRVRLLDVATNTLATVAGSAAGPGDGGDGGPATEAQLDAPIDVAASATGLYIADIGTSTIRFVDGAGIIHRLAGTSGVASTTGDDGPAAAASLAAPTRLTVDSADSVYVVTGPRVRRIGGPSEPDAGIITTYAGGGGTPPAEGVVATDAFFGAIADVHVDAQDRLLIADATNNRVWRVDAAGRLQLVAGNGTPASSGDFTAATDAALQPTALALDGAGNVTIADVISTGGSVRQIDAAGHINSVLAPRDPPGVGDLASASLASARAISEFDDRGTFVAGGRTGTIELVTSTNVSAVVGRTNLTAPVSDSARYRDLAFGEVAGVVYDPTGAGAVGDLYLSESSRHRLHVVALTDVAANSWTIATLNPDAPAAGGFQDGDLASARFHDPRGLWLTDEQLLVADTGNQVIRSVDLTAGVVSTPIGQPGLLGFAGDGGPADAARLFAPRALTTCPNGDIFIADTGNNRVRRVTGAARTISTVLGTGSPSSLGDGSPATSYPVWAPSGVVCDARGNVVVTSTETIRMLLADDAGVVDGTGPVQTIYGAYPRQPVLDAATRCLTGLTYTAAGDLRAVDACSGVMIELRAVVADQ